jgi:hypothetical protein
VHIYSLLPLYQYLKNYFAICEFLRKIVSFFTYNESLNFFKVLSNGAVGIQFPLLLMTNLIIFQIYFLLLVFIQLIEVHALVLAVFVLLKNVSFGLFPSVLLVLLVTFNLCIKHNHLCCEDCVSRTYVSLHICVRLTNLLVQTVYLFG